MILQLALTSWLHAWDDASTRPVQRALLADDALCRSELVLAGPGSTTHAVEP